MNKASVFTHSEFLGSRATPRSHFLALNLAFTLILSTVRAVNTMVLDVFIIA